MSDKTDHFDLDKGEAVRVFLIPNVSTNNTLRPSSGPALRHLRSLKSVEVRTWGCNTINE